MSKNNHPIEQEELMAYLDGELPVDRAGTAAGHLEHCRECQGLAADLQSVSRRMMEWEIQPIGREIGPTLVAALHGSGARHRPRTRWMSKWVLSLASV
jgi:anti-sigma factor RsiW